MIYLYILYGRSTYHTSIVDQNYIMCYTAPEIKQIQSTEMRTREKLNLQYKAAKLAGTTNATSFKAYLTELETAKNTSTETVQLAVTTTLKLLTHQKQVVEEKKQTKANIARNIFNEMLETNQHLSRKEIILQFMEFAGLTKAGASTYLQNIKKELNLM